MVNSVEVRIAGNIVGSITVEPAPTHLRAHRTAGGFRLHLPLTIRLAMKEADKYRPLVTNVWATLSVQDGNGQIHHLGQARCDGLFLGAYRESVQPGELIWSDVLAALSYYERLRDGRPARMRFDCSGEACHLFSMSQWVRTEPQAVSGQAEVEYPAHVWVTMLRELKVAENVLVEVPLPGIPPNGWENVWQALVEARNAFEQGGEPGWSQCVVKVRQALELWDNIEPEKKLLPDQPREHWSKSDRLDGFRWHLRNCAHLAAHPGASWSRAEALLMVSTMREWTGLTEPRIVQGTLEGLEELGWIRAEAMRARDGGRPTVRFRLNPRLPAGRRDRSRRVPPEASESPLTSPRG